MGLFDTREYVGGGQAIPTPYGSQQPTQSPQYDENSLPPTPGVASQLINQQPEVPVEQAQTTVPTQMSQEAIPSSVERDGITLATPMQQELPMFQSWLERNKVKEPYHPDQHYDYLSAFREGVDRDDTGHFTDKYKLPGHPTFSKASKHYKPGMKAGTWDEQGNFVPWSESLGDKIVNAPIRATKGAFYGARSGIPEMLGKAGEWVGLVKPETAKSWVDSARKAEETGTTQVERESDIYQGARFIAPLLLPAPLKMAATALKAGTTVPTTVKALEFAAAYLLPATFGASTAQETRDRAKEAGVEEGIAPYLTGLVMSVGMGVTQHFLNKAFGTLGAKVLTPEASAAAGKEIQAAALKGTTASEAKLMEAMRMKTGMQMLQDNLATILPASLGTQWVVAFSNALIEKNQGIRPKADPIAEANSTLGPTLWMNAFLQPTMATAQYIKGKKTLTQLKQEFDVFAQNVREAEKVKAQEERSAQLEGKEVFEGVKGEFKETGELTFSPMEMNSIQTMHEKEKILTPKATLDAHADNTKAGDIIYDQNQQSFKVDSITPEGKIAATPQMNVDVAGPKLQAFKESVPEALRDKVAKAYDYMLTNVKRPEANVMAFVEESITPELSRQQIRELYKIASGERVKVQQGTTGVFEGGMLKHGAMRIRESGRPAMTAEHLKGLDVKNSAQLVNAIHKAQLKGMNVSGMLNFIKDKETADAFLAKLNKPADTTEVKMEKKAESLQDNIVKATADFIRINRGPKRTIKDTGGTKLSPFSYERAVAATEAELSGELARLKEKYPENVYEIMKRPPVMEGQESPGFQIARRVKEFKETVDRETGRPEPDIKAEAVRNIMLAIRGSVQGKTEAQVKTIAEDLYKKSLAQANATPKEQLQKLYESRGFGPAMDLAEAAKDHALKQGGMNGKGSKELKSLVKDWWTRELQKPKYAESKKIEFFAKLAQDIQDPKMAQIITVAKLDPAILRDFIAGKSAVTVREQAKAKQKEVKTAKKEQAGSYPKYLGTLRTNLSKALVKMGKLSQGSTLGGNKPKELMAAAIRMGMDEKIVKKISGSAYGFAQEGTGEGKGKAKPKAEVKVEAKKEVPKAKAAPKKKEVAKKEKPVVEVKEEDVVVIETDKTPEEMGVFEVDAEGNVVIDVEAEPTAKRKPRYKTGEKGTDEELRIKADEKYPKGKLTPKGFITERFNEKGELKYSTELPALDEKGRVTVPVDLGRDAINNADKYRLAAEKFASKNFQSGTTHSKYGKLLGYNVDRQGNIVLEFDRAGTSKGVVLKSEVIGAGKRQARKPLTNKPRVTVQEQKLKEAEKKRLTTTKQEKTSVAETGKPSPEKSTKKGVSKKDKSITVPATVKGRTDVTAEDKVRIVKESVPDVDADRFLSENAQLANGVFRSEAEFKLALDVTSKAWLRQEKVNQSTPQVVGKRTAEGRREAAEKLMKRMLGFVENEGPNGEPGIVRSSLTKQEKADLKREVDKFLAMGPNRARTMLKKTLDAGMPKSEMQDLMDLMTDESIRGADGADLQGDTRGGQFDPFKVDIKETDGDYMKSSYLATHGRRVYNQNPNMNFGEWRTRVRDYIGEKWDTVKRFARYVWNRITQVPSPYVEQTGDVGDIQRSSMFRNLDGREIFYKFDTEIKKHIKEAGNEITKRAIKTFDTRLSIRTDTRAPAEFNTLFELAIEFSRSFKNARGDRAIPITKAEIQSMRDYLDHQAIIYNRTMSDSIARAMVKEVMTQVKGTEGERKLQADEIVWKMMNPYMLSDKVFSAIVKDIKSRGVTRVPLGDNWMIATTELGKPYLLRRVTDTIRNAVLRDTTSEVLGDRMNGDIAYKYSNDIHTVKGKYGEFISLGIPDVFKSGSNRLLLQRLELLENALHGYKIDTLTDHYGKVVDISELKKGGVNSGLEAGYLEALSSNIAPKITMEYLQKRLPEAKVEQGSTNGRFDVTLPNGFKFTFNQPMSRVETYTRINEEGQIEKREVGVTGAWHVRDFNNSLIEVMRDIDKNYALKTLDHEIFHMAVDTALTRNQQRDMLGLFKKETDVNDIKGWERAADAFKFDAEWRRTNPLATKVADVLVYAAHEILGATGRYVEPAKMRDHIFRQVASGKIFQGALLNNRAQFPNGKLSAVIVNGQKHDPNIDAKNSWAEEYKDTPMYSLLKKVTDRDSERTFFHNPSTIRAALDLLKSYKARDFYAAKGKLVSRIEHWLSNPVFLALSRAWEDGIMKPKYKGWHDSVRGVQEWDSAKAADMHKFLLEHTKEFQTMKPEEAKMFDPLAEWSNWNKKYLTEEQLRDAGFMLDVFKKHNPEIKTGKLTEATIKGYLEITKFLKDEMLPTLRNLAEEALLKPYSFGNVLTLTEYGKLAELYRDLIHNKKTADVQGILKEYPNVAKAYKSVTSKLTDLRRIRNEMNFGLEGFFPMRRNQGPYYVAIARWTKNPKYDPNKAGSKPEIREILHNYSAANSGMAKRIQDYISSAMMKDSQFKNTETDRYEVIGGRSHQLEDSSFFLVGDMNTQMVVDQALSDMVGKQKIDLETANKLSDVILQNIADTMRSRGAMSTAIARTFIKWEKSPIIQGYIKDDMRKVTNGYVAGVYGLKHKLDAAILAAKIVKEVPDNMPQMKSDISEYWKENLRNLDKYDMAISKAKAIAFNMYLLGKASFSVMQLTQNFVTGIPVLAAEMKQMGFKKGMLGAERIYTKAMTDLGFRAIGRHEFKPDELRLLNNMEALGITLPQTAKDLGIEAAAFGDGVRLKIMKALAWPVAATETFNRQAAALAMYRMLRGVNEKAKTKMTEEEIYEKVSHYIDKTHYWMGRGNMPAFARGSGGLGKAGNLMYTFGRFWHNYALSLFYGFQHYGKAGGAAMAARSFAWLAALGGVSALPFVDDLQEIYEKTTGKPVRSMAKKAIKQSYGDNAKRFYEAGMLGFVLGDMSAAIKPLRMPFMGNASESLLGVYYGLGSKIARGTDALIQGDSLKAVTAFSPAMTENIGKAYMTYTRGYRGAGNKLIYDAQGKPLKITPKEAVLMGLGFKPYEASQVAEERRTFDNVKRAWSSKRDNIMERARLAKTNAELTKVGNEITKYNLSIPKELQGVIPRAQLRPDQPDKKWLMFMHE